MNTKRIILLTEDGSHTIVIPSENISYHSTHGALQESMHVFIQTGLQYVFDEHFSSSNNTINIFEAGFGTGLNALLSLQFAVQHQQKINYETIELFPLSVEESNQLNYINHTDKNLAGYFRLMHGCNWNETINMHPLFSFKKIQQDVLSFETHEQFNLIYFDAFDPNTQPELWTETIFKKMFSLLQQNGVLTTYCSKGIVRRAMQSAGFTVEKLKGPKGKREIVRALKL